MISLTSIFATTVLAFLSIRALDYIWRSIDERSCRRFAEVRINVFSSRLVRPSGDLDTLGKTTAGNSIQFLVAGSLLPRGEQIFWGTSDLPVLAKTSGYVYTRCVSYECKTPDVHSDMLKTLRQPALGCNFFTIVWIIFSVCYNFMSVTIEYYFCYYNLEMPKCIIIILRTYYIFMKRLIWIYYYILLLQIHRLINKVMNFASPKILISIILYTRIGIVF